jgi:hypothetical protein
MDLTKGSVQRPNALKAKQERPAHLNKKRISRASLKLNFSFIVQSCCNLLSGNSVSARMTIYSHSSPTKQMVKTWGSGWLERAGKGADAPQITYLEPNIPKKNLPHALLKR